MSSGRSRLTIAQCSGIGVTLLMLAGIARDAGLPVDEALAGISDQATKDALKANTEEAIERGAFGAPTFFVGDQMFFGNDRFDFIEQALNE